MLAAGFGVLRFILADGGAVLVGKLCSACQPSPASRAAVPEVLPSPRAATISVSPPPFRTAAQHCTVALAVHKTEAPDEQMPIPRAFLPCPRDAGGLLSTVSLEAEDLGYILPASGVAASEAEVVQGW